ncbi:MAG: hypothetical protein JWM74_1270 [Myxococcaceae bacterium]|nr:hypothetical protein [Myxococcaceae bacterium]
MKTARPLVLGLVLVSALAMAGCKPKTELTCRWMTQGSKEENLKGPDPVVALTAPWTDLGVETDKATVCVSTPTQVKVLYKDRGDWFDAFTDIKKSLEGKGYKLTKFDGAAQESGMVEATLDRASDKSTARVSVNSWPKDVWKSKPYDLTISLSSMRAPD